MEVIFFSNNTEKSKHLQKITDKIIMSNRFRLMSLHTIVPSDTKELNNCIKEDRGYLIIIDISGYSKWHELIEDISSINRRITFCVISEDNDAAAELINMMANICGYINCSSNNIQPIFEKMLIQIYGRVTTICGGIMTTAKSGALKVIEFDDIYYIETIKHQHLCTVMHKNGSDVIRADICKLIKQLDSRFEISRSSTVVNLSNIKEINNGMIVFNKNTYCSVTAGRLAGIKRLMAQTKIH